MLTYTKGTKMKTQKQILATIRALAGRAKTWRDDVQGVLVDIAGHILEHGDVTVAKTLLDSIGNGANRPAIARWLGTNAFCHMVEGKLACSKGKRKDCASGFGGDFAMARPQYEEQLRSLPAWYEEGKEADDENVKAVFDALSKVETLIATIAKKTTKGEGTHLDLERYLRAAVEQYKADRAVFETMKGE